MEDIKLKMKCFVFHRGFKHSKTIKALGLWPRAFISFLVFETPMKHSHSFLKYYLKNTSENSFISGAITTDPYKSLYEQKKKYYNLYKTKAVQTDSNLF